MIIIASIIIIIIVLVVIVVITTIINISFSQIILQLIGSQAKLQYGGPGLTKQAERVSQVNCQGVLW